MDTIKLLKEKYPELKNEKMTYAGRLDPMAEGALIVLARNAIYEKERYLKMDKEYEGEILFGFETDTYDALGMPEKIIHYRRSMSIVKIRMPSFRKNNIVCDFKTNNIKIIQNNIIL